MNSSSSLDLELENQDALSYKYIIISNLQITLYAVVFLLGLLGNALVIYVVFRFRKMQTITNTYLINLAIADELFLLGIPFLIVTILKEQWIFGSLICKAYMILTSISQFASSLFLLVISADRYLAICHSVLCQKLRTITVSKATSLSTWLLCLFLIIPIIRYSNTVTFQNRTSCVINWYDIEDWTNSVVIFTIYTFVISFAIPLSLILVFYFMIVYKLVMHEDKTEEKRKTNRRVTKMVLIVVTVYIVCLLPYWVMQILLLVTAEPSGLIINLHLLSSALHYVNSAVNPILYAFLSKTFCKSFVRVCICKMSNKKQNKPLMKYQNNQKRDVVPPNKNNKTGFQGLMPRKRSIFVCENNDAYQYINHPSMSDAQSFLTTLTVQSSLSDSSEESCFGDDDFDGEQCCNNVSLDTTSL